MSAYLVTISWQDPTQSLRRLKETITVDLEITQSSDAWYIVSAIKEAGGWRAAYYDEDIAIDFMMKLD